MALAPSPVAIWDQSPIGNSTESGQVYLSNPRYGTHGRWGIEKNRFLEPMQNTGLRCPDETLAGTQGYRIDVSLRSAGDPLAEPAEPEIHGTAFVLLLETKQSTNSKGRRQSLSPAKTQNQDNRKPRKNR